MRVLPIVALVGSLAACATIRSTVHSYSTEMNGLETHESSLRQSLATGAFGSAWEKVGRKGSATPSDELLRDLYRGAVAYYAGKYDESAASLDHADALAEDRYTKSVGHAALAIATNDNALPYEPGHTERLLVPYYAMLGYLHRGALVDAGVEARKLGVLLERYGDDKDPGDRRIRATLEWLSGQVFASLGETNDAQVAARRARALVPDSLLPRAPKKAAAGDSGDVVIVLEHSFVAHRVDRTFYLAMSPTEVLAFTGGSDAWKSEQGIRVQSRVFGQLGRDADDGIYDDGIPTIATDDSLGSSSHLYTMSWPVYHRPYISRPHAVVHEGDSLRVPVAMLGDVTAGVLADYRRERPEIIARTVLRAVAHNALQQGAAAGAKAKMGKKAGKVAGVAAELASAAMERADTRSWQLVPGTIGVSRVRLPAGVHHLHADVWANGEMPTIVDLGDVTVTAGGTAFVTGRDWTDSTF